MSIDAVKRAVDRATFDRFVQYVALLDKWRRVTNLVSDAGFSDIWERHILDALTLYAQKPAATCWLDMGAGAGIPGVIIACMLAEVPKASVHCVEIDRRKCSFLRAVTSDLRIPLKVHNVLAEEIAAADLPLVQVVTARAFSSVDRILELAEPFLSKGAIAILPRGKSGVDEVAQLGTDRYTVDVTPNAAPRGGVFLRIGLRDSHR